MKKNNFLLVSFLAMAMTFSMASCSSSDDPDSPDIVNPGGGTENPGGGSETPGGSGTAELTAAQAKQSLEATAQELLGKMNVSDLQEFKNMIDGVDYKMTMPCLVGSRHVVMLLWFQAATMEPNT